MKKKNADKKPPFLKKWKEEFYVTCYELARTGMADKAIAKAIGCSFQGLSRWKNRRPALAEAIERGRRQYAARHGEAGDKGGADSQGTFRAYVYDRLPGHLKRLWEEINACEDEDNGVLRLEALLSKAGQRARQHLFFYALVHNNFNASAACRTVNIPKKTLESWIHDDPSFAELMDEIHWHKKNMIQGALFDRIESGDVSAIIFASRTINRDWGYNEKVDINANVKVEHNHNLVDVDKLPLAMRKLLLEHLQSGGSPEDFKQLTAIDVDSQEVDDDDDDAEDGD
jgi:hypothetical protein